MKWSEADAVQSAIVSLADCPDIEPDLSLPREASVTGSANQSVMDFPTYYADERRTLDYAVLLDGARFTSASSNWRSM